MMVYTGKFYLLMLTAVVLLCGCDMQHDAKRHPLFVKAEKLERNEDYPAAVEYYKRFLNVYPESPAVHKALATIYDDRLLQYLPAIYHYDRYLEYAPNASDHADMQKWRNAVQRKYYLKARREYNDPNDVQLLKRKNDSLNLNVKKSVARQRQLIDYIRKVKIDIAAVRTASEKLKTRAIDLEIKLENSERNLNILKTQLAKVNHELDEARIVNLKLIETANQNKTSTEQVENEDKNKTADKNIMDDAPNAKEPSENEVTDTEIPAEQITQVKLKPPPVTTTKTTITTTTEQLYTVKSGDTLSRISRKFYGNSKYYRHIMNANKILLKTAKDLRPGQQLIIPSLKEQ
ncbi:MAG: LysM peptidoglycan-binding domain-containing protein [Victivallaceae bacterium]|nr:LysM peptidoglycan-binding domain-containing protein [Victivallaceae bacterium]